VVHELPSVIHKVKANLSRTQCPRDLKDRSAAARHMRLWVRIPRGAWTFFCTECCVLYGGSFTTSLSFVQRGSTDCSMSLRVI